MSAARERAVRIAENAGAAGLILMRALVGASDPWWTDWIVLLAAFWLLRANARDGRAVAGGAHLLMALMALIYLARQGPYLLRAYGLGP